MAQRPADLEKQGHGEPLGVEGFVNVFGSAVHLLGQPHGRAALPLQLGFYKLAKVQLRGGYRFVLFHRAFFLYFVLDPLTPDKSLSEQHTKKVELSFNSLHSVGSGLPVSKILKNKPHLIGNYTMLIGKLDFRYPC